MRQLIKVILPVGVYRRLQAIHRKFVFWNAMRRFKENPGAALWDDRSILSDLIYGWGNESWSALHEYLAECIRQALVAAGPILECGSGLSTIIIGAIAQQGGNAVWTLEHAPEWGNRVQKCLDSYGINSVNLCVNSLKDYADFSWYDPPKELMPEKFSLVICDGPPGYTRGGRYGLIPIMRERITAGCIILLDDAARDQEREIARRWAAEINCKSETVGLDKPYIRMTVME